MWQYGIELTYPNPVQYMAGLNGLVQQLLAVIVVQIGQSIISKFSAVEYASTTGGLAANIFNCALLLVAVIMQLFVKQDLRRDRINCIASLKRRRSTMPVLTSETTAKIPN